ncbi:MAG: hypothetical protein CME65_08295 [Halobacteriovoraceae bacterium]|nr:hypothetical protein [Halobacteriovoraceae bacterium]
MIEFEVRLHKLSSGYIQTVYRDPKTGLRKRKRFGSLREAKEYKKKVEARVKSKGVNAFSDLRVSQAMKTYLEKYPKSQIRCRKNHFKSFIDTFGIYRVSEITTSDLQVWMEENQKKDSLSSLTMNRVKSHFNGFFKYLKDEELIGANPIAEVQFKRFDNPRRKRVVLSIDEVKTVLENAKKFSPELLYPYLATAAHTGARKGEIFKLNREDIDFETGLIHFRETKNSHSRFVRISPMLEAIMKEHLDSHGEKPYLVTENKERINRGVYGRLFNKFKAFFPLENKDWGSHSLRHSFAYNYLKKGGKMYQLQAILGHRSIDVTIDLYGQLQAQDIDCPSPYED